MVGSSDRRRHEVAQRRPTPGRSRTHGRDTTRLAGHTAATTPHRDRLPDMAPSREARRAERGSDGPAEDRHRRRRIRRLPRRPHLSPAGPGPGRDRRWSTPPTTSSTCRCCPRSPPACSTRAGSPCRCPATLPDVRLILGEVDRHRPGRAAGRAAPTPRATRGELGYDRLVLAVGSVNKLLPIPGVTEHAHGFRGIPEALYLRDHLDPADRAGRRRPTTRPSAPPACTFVVVGAGYTGTEVAAQGVLLHRHPARPAPAAGRRTGRAGCCWTWPSGCCPSSTRGCRAPPTAVLRRRGRGGADRHLGAGGDRRRRPAERRQFVANPHR